MAQMPYYRFGDLIINPNAVLWVQKMSGVWESEASHTVCLSDNKRLLLMKNNPDHQAFSAWLLRNAIEPPEQAKGRPVVACDPANKFPPDPVSWV